MQPIPPQQTAPETIMSSLKEMYLLPFKALASATRVFIHNRLRMKALASKPLLARAIRYGMLATMLVWLLIALLTRGEEDNRLDEAMKAMWSKATSGQASGNPDQTQ